jgi:RecB family endonuclease NucS
MKALKEHIKETVLLRTYGPPVTFLTGLVLLLIHSFRPDVVQIDWWTMLLLGLLIFIPFSADIKELIVGPEKGLHLRKSTEEFRKQVENSKENALQELRSRVNDLEGGNQEEVQENLNQNVSLIREEVNELKEQERYQAAFMKLMQNIERELRNILSEEDVADFEHASLGEMVNLAREYNVLSSSLINNLEDIRPVRNQVAHGREVNSDEILDMIDLGLDLYEALISEGETAEITENAIIDAIRHNPEIVEDGFQVQDMEVPTEFGRVDLLGEDSEGNSVVVEIKSYSADKTHIKQLMGFLESQREDLGDEVRGILITPSVRANIEDLSTDRIKIKRIDPANL